MAEETGDCDKILAFLQINFEMLDLKNRIDQSWNYGIE